MIKDLLIRIIKVTKTTKDGTHQYPDYFGIFASKGENHTISIKIAKTAQGFIEANRKNNFIDLKLNISTAKKEEGVNGFYTYVSKKNAEGKYIRIVNKEGEYIPQIVITKLTAFSLSKEVLKQFDKPHTEEKKADESSQTTTGICRSREHRKKTHGMPRGHVNETTLWNKCPRRMDSGYVIFLFEYWYDYSEDADDANTSLNITDNIIRTFTTIQSVMVKQVNDIMDWIHRLGKSNNLYRILVRYGKDTILEKTIRADEDLGRRWSYATRKFEPIEAVQPAKA